MENVELTTTTTKPEINSFTVQYKHTRVLETTKPTKTRPVDSTGEVESTTTKINNWVKTKTMVKQQINCVRCTRVENNKTTQVKM